MKRYPDIRSTARHLPGLMLAACLALPLSALAATVELATAPLASATTSSISPNLMFILDDSGSMGWSYMPDNANDFDGAYGYASNQCNGVYYNPDITYTAPVKADGTSYSDASFTAAWNDGYKTSSGTTNLDTSFAPSNSYNAGKAFYYLYSGTQTTADKKNYYDTNSVFYKECNSVIGSTALVDGTHPVNTLFTKRTLATTENTFITVSSGGSATITVNSANNFRAGGIIVSGAGGGEIMSGRSTSSSSTGTVANNIATKINSCTVAATGNCTVSGYSATVSGSVITITGPAAGGATLTISVDSGSWTNTATAFSTPVSTAVSSITVNGVQLLLSGATASTTSATTLASSIASGINATGYSATASGSTVTITGPASAANYSPVSTTVPASGGMTLSAGTFPETAAAKLTNFANWYSYYRTRMLMMKTATGLAFKAIDNKYRVGFMTINNNVSPDALNVAPFWNNTNSSLGALSTQKTDWYAKLYASVPNNSTPLREALSKAGLFYAHKLPSNTLNGLAMNDPIQYSCQQNFTILSTDGFWNGNDGFKLDGSSAVGNQDGLAPRPLYDGGQISKTTSQTQKSQTQLIKNTTQNQKKTLQIQSQTSSLQSSVANIQSSTSSLQQQTSQLQKQTSQLQKQTSSLQFATGTLQKATSSDKGSTWSSWSNVASCTWNSTSNGFATITVNGSGSTSVSSIKVNGVTEILSATTSASSTKSTVASRIKNNISLAGYTATVGSGGSSNVVTVSGPTAGTLSITDDGGGMSFTTAAISFRTKCQYATLSAWANSSSTCTANDQSASTSDGSTWSGNQVACQYTSWSAAVNSACTAVNKSASSPYSVLTAVQCSTAISSPFADVSSCTVTTPDASGVSTQCQYTAYTAWANVSSCTTVAKSAGPTNYTVGTAANCQYTAYTTPANVSSCTVVAKSGGSPYTVGTATNCTYAAYTTPANVSSCTAVAKSTASPYVTATNCSYTAYNAWANASSCTPMAKSTASPYTVGTATNCQTTDSGWVNVASCSPGVSGGQTVTCQTLTTGPTPVASCTSAAATSPNWIATSCTTNTIMPATLVGSCIAASPSASNSYVETVCNTSATTLNNLDSCSPQTASASNSWTTISCSSSGGTSDTLADVAMYYYETDLRTPALSNCGTVVPPATEGPLCLNNVFISGADNNVKQHMTTFTLGLGARGRMVFSSDYPTQISGDFYSVKTGATTDLTASPQVCSWQAAGTACNWPVPASDAIENIDDLWHAAVDGRGTYFSATDPASLSTGLSSALSSITARKGAAAAAATSTLNPVPGDNLAYLASYTTVKWTGNVEARSINVVTGDVSKTATWCVENTVGGTCSSPGTIVVDTSGSSTIYNCVTPDAIGSSCTGTWDGTSCIVQLPHACTGTLPAMVSSTSDSRIIKTPDSAGTALVDFVYANLDPANFDAAHIGTLSQWTALTATQKTNAEGANLVNFLRGQIGFEDRAVNLVSVAVDNRLYRYREAVLGDVLESQPVFMGGPVFSYSDAGYTDFKTYYADRLGTVYVGANDGMLHAFAAKDNPDASPPDIGGKERWAYVPSMVIPNMWKLADKSYDIKHTNFINGSPNAADIFDSASSEWRTILVGGLNAGGRGYYALDITDPLAPTLKWEFTTADDANVGYSYGNPVVTKLANGTWVVLVTSGYNNADGVGYLYVLNATTGAIIRTISTGVGDPTTPSGLARIAVWNNTPASNEAGFTYGGDLLGNVWRFDVNNDGSSVNPLKFATLFADVAGTSPQPITTVPVLGKILGKRVVFIGTGKYLELGDLTTTQVESQYAIKDDDATTTLVNPRNSLVQQTLALTAVGATTRTGSTNAVDFNDDRGWYVDFPPGERVNIDSSLISGTLLVPTLVPSSTACSPGGYGWFNFFDYLTGGIITESVQFNSAIVGYNVFYINKKPILTVVLSDGDIIPPPCPDGQCIPESAASGFAGKRSSWRELFQK